MRTSFWLALGLLLALTAVARAEEPAPDPPPAPEPQPAPATEPAPQPTPPKLVVAVLAVEAAEEDLASLAGSLPLLVEATLGTCPEIRLVTRRDLDAIQEEQELNLAGLVEAGRGAEVGRLIGADVLVVGRVARLDDELLFTAKAVGSQTGAILPAVARGREQDGAAALAARLAETLADLLRKRGGEILPASAPEDETELNALRQRIEKLEVTLPRLALHVPERHLRGARVPDPAAETAFLQVFRALGFAVAPIPGARERAWLEKTVRGEGDFPAPKSLAADLAVVGEAFSEYAGRVGRFVSCRARVEIRVYDVETGRIVATHVGKGSKADLSEGFAGKLALEALGREAARTLALALARTGRKEAPSTPAEEE